MNSNSLFVAWSLATLVLGLTMMFGVTTEVIVGLGLFFVGLSVVLAGTVVQDAILKSR